MTTIGDTGAPNSNTIYYDALLSTTLMAYKKTLEDNIFKDSAFLAYLKMAGGTTTQDGGERIAIPLMYGDNETVKTHGGYSVLDTTPQEGITTAFYPWAEIAGTISISRKEERQNSGEGRLINLLKAKITQAEMTIREKLNQDILNGTWASNLCLPDTADDGAYGVVPLACMMPKLNATDPTAFDIGGIARDTYSWWRHRTATLSGTSETGNCVALDCTTWASLKFALKRFYNFCSRGTGGSPDLVVMDQSSYEQYESSLEANLRYSNTKMADMGFDTIKLKGATCVWDEVVPDVDTGVGYDSDSWDYGTAFFLNTKFYKLVTDSQTSFITTPFVEPENQTAKTAKILWMGNTTCSNFRKMGVASEIDDSVVS